jgi:hypothetical protein
VYCGEISANSRPPLTERLECLQQPVIPLVLAHLFGFAPGVAASEDLHHGAGYRPRSILLARAPDEVAVAGLWTRRHLEVGLDDRFPKDEPAVVVLFGPVAPVHLPHAEVGNLRLRLGDAAESPEEVVFLAAFVNAVDAIDNIATHRGTPLSCCSALPGGRDVLAGAVTLQVEQSRHTPTSAAASSAAYPVVRLSLVRWRQAFELLVSTAVNIIFIGSFGRE